MHNNPLYDASNDPLYETIPNITPLGQLTKEVQITGQSEQLHCSSTVSASAEFKLHLPLRPAVCDNDEYIKMTPSAVPVVTSPRYSQPPEFNWSTKPSCEVVDGDKTITDARNDTAIKYESLL